MEKLFEASPNSLILIALSIIGIYIATILFTRFAGKRSFSKMSSFDFAMTVAIGSIVASTALTQSISLLQGVVGLALVYILQISIAMLRRYDFVQKLVDNTPMLLMDGEKILYQNLKKARVAETDLRSKLREANVLELSEVRAVIFETTGDISVLHTKDTSVEVDNWLLKDVTQ